MTYNEAEKLMLDNVKIVQTNGNKKFPYQIHKLLIMPTGICNEEALCIIKWAVGNDLPFKKAFDVCELKQQDFDVYVYTKEQNIKPISLSEYFS